MNPLQKRLASLRRRLRLQIGWGGLCALVGLVVTPSLGATHVTGVRFYTGADSSSDDPADFKLEGSTNGGASYTAIVQTMALALPVDRNDAAHPVNPLNSAVQEINFVNQGVYRSYRLTFQNTRDNNTANLLSLGELELLGTAASLPPPAPVISGTVLSGGNLNLTIVGGAPNGSYSVVTNGILTVPLSNWGTLTTGTFDVTGSATFSVPVGTSNPQLFYLIKQP